MIAWLLTCTPCVASWITRKLLSAFSIAPIAAILSEPVASGDKLMLMVHGEDGGMKTGGFEYSLGAKEDGPVKVDGKLVMTVITAQ